MPLIPTVRSGEKIRVSARTLNIIAEFINRAPVLSSGRPFGGGKSVNNNVSTEYYKGYFKLSIVSKTRQVANPDYDPENPDSPQYITEEYKEAHHSGGKYTINGQVGTKSAADVSGDLSSSMQDVILHYHYNSGTDVSDLTPTGVTVELNSLASNTLTDSYWLIGQASVNGVIQQSHGVPALLWFGCREEETPQEETPQEGTPQE